jgi:hypothetical protein
MAQAGKSLLDLIVVDTDGQRPTAADHDHQLAATGDSRINQVTLQQNIMLGQNRQNNDRIFRPL